MPRQPTDDRAPESNPGSEPSPRDNLYTQVVTPIDEPTAVAAACPICEHPSARARYRVHGVEAPIVVCDGCATGRYEPMPTTEQIAGFYPDHYYGDEGAKFEPLVEALVRLVGARHARAWTRGLPPGGRILDLGCGRGVLLRAFLDQGFEGHGMETSEAAVRGIDPRAKLQIAPDLRECGYPDEHFDQVVIWHVLEHLADPRGILDECRRILRPGGRVVVAVPNFSSWQARWSGAAWFHLDPPRHLVHFPVEALRDLLDRCGFEPTSTHHFSLRQNPFGWVQSALNRVPGLPRNGLYTLIQPQSDVATTWPWRRRALLRAAYLLGMPVAAVLSVLTALANRGATVTVVGRRRNR